MASDECVFIPKRRRTSKPEQPDTGTSSALSIDIDQGAEEDRKLEAPLGPPDLIVLAIEDRKLEAPFDPSQPLDEILADVPSGVATPTWESITVEQLLDWGEDSNPFLDYQTFLRWKEMCSHGLSQMANSALVGGPLNMDYCHQVLGESDHILVAVWLHGPVWASSSYH